VSIDALKAAYARYCEALILRKDELHRDGAIQRFEYTFELSWKALKRELAERGVETNSPRQVIRQAAAEGIIDSVESWFDFLEKRNLSSHVYREDYAKAVEGVFEPFKLAAGELISRLERRIP
jgi:nucleotidyltransferase substrate binding protein (TIGR01987 family)